MINDIFTIIIRGVNAVNSWFMQFMFAIDAWEVVLGVIAVSVAFRFIIYPMLKPSAGSSDSVRKTNKKEEE